MGLFPYIFRKFQEELVESISVSTASSSHLVLESGTGTGKTVCALAGTLDTALKNDKKVLYLTRTNSQQHQVMVELRKINEVTPVFGVAIQGRQNTCPLVQRDPDLRSGTPEELSKLCAEKKARAISDSEGGCRFYQKTITSDFEEVEKYCREHLPSVEEFSDYCNKRGMCPHELTKDLLSHATVVAAPYVYFFSPFIRQRLLDWMNVSETDLIVIVDEAHNLPEYAREIKSFKMSSRVLELVNKELDDFGNPEVLQGITILDFVKQIEILLKKAQEEYLIEDDGIIPPDFLEAGLMSSFFITSHALEAAGENISEFGDSIRDAKRKKGRLPRSYIYSLGNFLQLWMDTYEEFYVKLVIGGENPAFEAYCMDPSIACLPVFKCHSSLHMSGTLSPLNEYRASIGIPKESNSIIFPSPFDPSKRSVIYADDVTTKYEELLKDEEIIRKMEDYTVSVCNTCNKNTAVFFSSYTLMNKFLEDKILLRIRNQVYMERKGMQQHELMEEVKGFKTSKPAVIFAVMGGRISEGIDFPGDELEIEILEGIPYPKPNAKQRALLHYYEIKFGRGWEYTVKAPVTRRLLQTLGRLIRTEDDRGIALILDKRAVQFSDRFRSQLSETPVNDIINFFDGR